MNIINTLFGHGKDLTTLQMSCRGMVVFLYTLILIRISGRRSFGIRTPLDNIIVILLGSILARGVVGVSPFFPIIVVCLLLVLIHRVLAWAIVHIPTFAKVIEGEKIILFQSSHFIPKHLNQGLLSEEDIMQGVRKSALTDDLDKIDKIYIEKNGEISAIKK